MHPAVVRRLVLASQAVGRAEFAVPVRGAGAEVSAADTTQQTLTIGQKQGLYNRILIYKSFVMYKHNTQVLYQHILLYNRVLLYRRGILDII